MRKMTSTNLGLPALLLAAALGCSGSSGGMGRVSVHLVDGPAVQFQNINLNVLKLEIGGQGGWVTLRDQPFATDLLSLTNGVVATLADGVQIPAGTYSQLRLVLGPGNTVTLKSDGSIQDLIIPSGLQSGLKILVNLVVAGGSFHDVTIDLDAKHSVFVHTTGRDTKYILRPVIRAAETQASGTISGTLTHPAAGPAEGEIVQAPLAGAEVFAEVVDGSGVGSVVASATTDDAGFYSMGLLPFGTYYVVSQPVAPPAAPVVYLAKASGALTLDPGAMTATYDASFDFTPTFGGVSGQVNPAAAVGDTDLLEVRQPFTGGLSLVIRSDGLDTGPSPELYAEAHLPVLAGSDLYTFTVTRASSGTTLTGSGQVAVAAGTIVPLDITVP
jgi:hypothetical protein